jgi:hypothetical protein
VPALVLAGEAELAGQPRRAAALRELAAAMCLMPRRGTDPRLLETLLVAST